MAEHAFAGIPLIVFCAIPVVFVIETVLSVKWNSGYFTVGLPIFVRRIESVKRVDDLPLDELQKSSATFAATPLLFRRLAPNVVAFRESFAGGTLHYMPIMRGVIRSRESDAAIQVLGLANWYFVAAIVALLSLLGRNIVVVAPYLLAAVAIVYFIQAVRYGRVAKAIRRAVATLSAPPQM